MKKNLSNTWSWDTKESHGFNVIAKLEETLIALDLIYDFSDIDVTESFDEKFSKTKIFSSKPIKDFGYNGGFESATKSSRRPEFDSDKFTIRGGFSKQ